MIGAGVLGLCTGYALQSRGVEVRVYEQGVAGSGQSGGEGRLLRHWHEDERLISWAARSRALYREWGSALGVETISPDGGVTIGERAAERFAALRRAGVPARMLEASELTARIPVLAGYQGAAVLDEEGGSIHTLETIEALSGALDGRIVSGEVLGLEERGGGVVVHASSETRWFHRVILCAGRGTPALAALAGIHIPLAEHVTLRCSFRVREKAPMLASLQDPEGVYGASAYGCASADRERYAVGLSGAALQVGSLTAWREQTVAYVEHGLPGLDPEPVSVRQCWVTELPWGHDGVAVWEEGAVLAAAGHNVFKHAPGLAEALAQAAVGGVLPEELRPEAQLGRGRRG